MITPKIETPRIELMAATEELVLAEINDRSRFSLLLGASIPAAWPPEYNDENTQHFILQQLQGRPELVGWWSWYFVLKGTATGEPILIGNGGFKGCPDANNSVEVGYSLLEEFHRRGYGSEAITALTNWAFEQGVQSITAETLPELTASIRLLEKNGFAFVGEGSEEGVILYRKERP